MDDKKRASYYNLEHQKKYRESKKNINLSFSLKKEEDVQMYEHLQAVGDKTNYIKSLIKKDMQDLENK